MSEDVTRRCDNLVKVGRRYEVCDRPTRDDEATVFSIDETAWSADLCVGCKMKLRDAIADFIKIANPEYTRVASGAIRKALRGLNGESFTVADVRKWCKENDIEVSVTGLVRQSVIDLYKEAHSLN